jgi:hypothetical protein
MQALGKKMGILFCKKNVCEEDKKMLNVFFGSSACSPLRRLRHTDKQRKRKKKKKTVMQRLW